MSKASGNMRFIWSRFSAFNGSRTPPGTAQAGWMLRPPSKRMTSWPNWRRRMPLRATLGYCWIKPMMLRWTGSLSMPSNRSGALRWKKLRAWLWTICPQFIRRRSFAAVGGMRTPRILSPALAEARQMADRADAADASRDARHFVEAAAYTKFLEAAELDHMEAGIRHMASVIQVDCNFGVSLDAGDGINRDCLCHGYLSDGIAFTRTCAFARPG